MRYRPSWHQFDWASCVLTFLISTIGLLFVFSATYRIEQPYSLFFKKQLIGIAIGWFLYAICCSIDHRSLARWSYFLYFILLGLLFFTAIKGSIGMGAQRWIDLVYFKAQPSELAKLLFPGFAAYYLMSLKDTYSFSSKEIAPIMATLIITTLLILKQPDLGTAILIFLTGITILWLAGLSKQWFRYGIIAAIILAPLGYTYLKPYQKQRIAVFLGAGNTQKERYQIEQASIAVGSGGIFGKGFLRGTQNKLFFLPESRTDFIFAVLAEEWGFVGTISIILLYLILFMRCFARITNIPSPYMQLLAIGCILPIVLATLINSAMVIGLLPIVGIPLPLMSYGLSNLWVTFMALGWFNGILIRQA